MCSTAEGLERSKDLMSKLGLSETMYQLAFANGVYCYGHAYRMEDGHVLRRALEFEGEGKKNWRMNTTRLISMATSATPS